MQGKLLRKREAQLSPEQPLHHSHITGYAWRQNTLEGNMFDPPRRISVVNNTASFLVAGVVEQWDNTTPIPRLREGTCLEGDQARLGSVVGTVRHIMSRSSRLARKLCQARRYRCIEMERQQARWCPAGQTWAFYPKTVRLTGEVPMNIIEGRAGEAAHGRSLLK